MDYICVQASVIVLGTGFSAFVTEMLNLFVRLLSLTAIVSSTPTSKVPTARVKNGTLEGVHSSAYEQDFFLGVPYAQPPVNDLRFRQARSLNTSWDGVRAVKEFQKLCVGYGVGPILQDYHISTNRIARSNFF